MKCYIFLRDGPDHIGKEGGEDVKSARPLCPGLHTPYNGEYKEQQVGDGKQISKIRLSVQIAVCNPPA